MALCRIFVFADRSTQRFIGELSPAAEGRIRERLGALRAGGVIADFSVEGFWADDNLADLSKLLDRLEARARAENPSERTS
jgi:hypothetical protein